MRNHRNKLLLVTAIVLSAASVKAQSTYIGANFRGTSRGEASNYIPPDTMGAVGSEHVMLMLNGRYELFTKNPDVVGIDGIPLAGHATSLSGFWLNQVSGSGFSASGGNFAFDPRVTYDPFAQRWYAVAADEKRSADSGLLFAVSNTADPRDGWAGFRWEADDTGQVWADFPMLGFDGQYVYISANLYPVASASSEYPLYSLPKSDLLAATPTVDNRQVLLLDSSTNQTTVALDNLGPEVQPYHLWEEGSGTMPCNEISAPGEILENSSGRTFLSDPTLGLPGNARQPDGTSDLDIDNDRISSRLVRTDGSYWSAFTRKLDGDNVIAWFEIDAVTLEEKQMGVIHIDGQDSYYPSIAVNPDGDVVIGFNASGPGAGQFPSVYAAVGTTEDGVTTFDTPMLLKAGTHSYHNVSGDRNRWGDYSNTALDPADPNIFWTFQEWASGSQDWSAQVTELITADADEFYWAEDASGSFSDTVAWLSGAAPTTAEHAIFSRPGNAYTVSFSADAVNDRASVRQGTAVWDLGGHAYRLENPSSATAALALAEYQGKASLSVTNGVLSTASAAIGTGMGAQATMTLSGPGTTWISEGEAYLGGDNPDGVGWGTLILENGASADIRGEFFIRPSGIFHSDQTITIDGGGFLQLDGILDAPLLAVEEGHLTGSGTLIGDLIIGGGILSPGEEESLLADVPLAPAGPIKSTSPAPEPGTLLMLLMAASALSFRRRNWR